jgi:hypothetical protein
MLEALVALSQSQIAALLARGAALETQSFGLIGLNTALGAGVHWVVESTSMNEQDQPGRIVLPSASTSPHVALSGGTLGGLAVVQDAIGKIEKGAEVETVDGRVGVVKKVKGRRLYRGGVSAGSIELELADGTTVLAPREEIVRVVRSPRRGAEVDAGTAAPVST